MAEIGLQKPYILLALPAIWLLLVAFSWRRRFKPFGPFLLRLAIIVLIMLALAQPVLSPTTTVVATPEEQLILLVDQSASLGPAGQEALRAVAGRLAGARRPVHTLFFAAYPMLVQDPLAALSPAAATNQADLNSEATNLAEALLLGGELLPDQPGPPIPQNPQGRLILLSDGFATAGNTLDAAAQLARRNIPVDALILNENDRQSWAEAQNEVQIVALTAPPVLRKGESYEVVVVVHSESAAETTLNLSQNQETLAEDVVTLERGLNRFAFAVTATTEGVQIFRARLAADADRRLENNSLSAFAQVYPAPQILAVGEAQDPTVRFAALLTEGGFVAIPISPDQLSDRLSELEPYAGIVLLDLPARSLRLEQMIALQEYVRSLGRGLVVIGGRNSFGPGRYEGTPLAELLPVSLEPPPREERPPVALLLIIDHSGSMVEQRQASATRLAMAKEAAIRATDILGPEDLVGVLMFDNRYEWVVPFQQVRDGAELLAVQQRIARVPPGGGTRILQALEIGLPALAEQQTANSRLAVLLTDGKSFDGDKGIEDYHAVVDAALEADVTLSTIAIGVGADQELLSHLAERGRGRYHYAEIPDELPALTISESDILRSQTLQEGDFEVAIFQPHPILRGLFSPLPDLQSEPPGLRGYLAMTPKPRSEIALQVGPGDPLLAVWGYGLGRVVAWSADTGDEWTPAWREWPDFSRFWGQVVGYTLPAPDLGLLQVETAVEPDGTVRLIADSLTSTGQPVDMARTQATLLTPGGEENRIALQQVEPGRYERRLHLPDWGAYQATVTQPNPETGEPVVATTAFVLSYPAEYGLPPEGTGRPLLEQIAAVTGGRTFSLDQLSTTYLSPTVSDEASTMSIELWPWLLGSALLLWPLEIAWRRWARLRIQ